METNVRSVRRDKFDFGLAFGVAVLGGTAATGILFGAAGALSSSYGLAGLGLGLLAAFFSAPFWLFGTALIGLPIAVAIDRHWRLTAARAVGIGAVSSTAVWWAALSPIWSGYEQLIQPLAMGAFLGGAAALMGWCAGAFSLVGAKP